MSNSKFGVYKAVGADGEEIFITNSYDRAAELYRKKTAEHYGYKPEAVHVHRVSFYGSCFIDGKNADQEQYV